ncbi:MAG: hypothetical protein IKT09_09480 [Synergistes sp.]|nr:hypothetical protein [Synergistes sp.]
MKQSFGGAKVSKLQFAPVSRWEEALIVEKGFNASDVRAWLAGLDCSHIGAEAFFETDRNAAFIGLRIPNSQAAQELCARTADGFLKSRAFAAGDFIRSAEEFSGTPLFRGEPEHMELGLVNMWKSYGALTFWKRGDGSPFARLAEALKEEPRYMRLLPAPPAYETAWDSPLPHWTGIYLSRAASGGYMLDITAAEKYLG